jgi:cellulose 1,4-beta-cellobiosidase
MRNRVLPTYLVILTATACSLQPSEDSSNRIDPIPGTANAGTDPKTPATSSQGSQGSQGTGSTTTGTPGTPSTGNGSTGTDPASDAGSPASGDAAGGGTTPSGTGSTAYLNPEYVAAVKSAADKESDAALKQKMQSVATYQTAIWLDRIAALPKLTGALDAAKAEQAKTGKAVSTVFVVYDLPQRDCAALSSAGELTLATKDKYKSDFIDPIAAALASHKDQPITLILEPDSLGNIVTNQNIKKCADAKTTYETSVSYAISKLSQAHVKIYLDAAHSGWLGWDNNRSGFVTVVKNVLNAAGSGAKIQGFATNVSNYTVIKQGMPVADTHPFDSNPCTDELTYVTKLSASMEAGGLTGMKFVIDTSRNGNAGIRPQWGDWCNVKNAGLGERPQANPRASHPMLDAFMWIKGPGESDGTSTTSAVRYDPSCSKPSAYTSTPEAGVFFTPAFKDLVSKAFPAL